ncbi:MAG: hypothetical protein ACLP9L_34000, partial [Thermoguttaceae bacterium]
MNAMTRLFIDYLQLGSNAAELTEWLSELADDAEDELDATPNYFAWLAEKRLDFIKQVDLVEAARRLKRVHHLEHAYMPRHKGKIESGVKYVKRNALKARQFESLEAENEFLLHWETT